MDQAERLVGAQRERRAQAMNRAARLAEAAAAIVFACVATGVALAIPFDRSVDPVLIAGLVLGYAAVLRVEFEIGPGYSVPEALLFVPMLFLAPLPLVPALVAVAAVLSRAPEVLLRRVHPDRLGLSLTDAWFTIGPVAVLGAFGVDQPRIEDAPVFALAMAAQFAAALGPPLLLDRIQKDVTFGESIRAIGWALRVDAVLWPIGLMAAFAAQDSPLILLAIAPLTWLLSVFSRERRERYAAALELNRAYRGTVMLLSDVVEADDNYTADHCRSVVELVTAVADELEIPERDRQELEFAALLHDVGKIAIPKEILNKPGKLNEEEFELMKTHTIEGQQMLDRVGGLLGRVGQIVRACHERWDGGGYPDGVSGEEIPLAARIVFCCDAYNAMTTTRVYRKAMPVEKALDELRDNAGSQFDPWVVAGLVRVIERGFRETRPSPADAVRAVFARQPPPALDAG